MVMRPDSALLLLLLPAACLQAEENAAAQIVDEMSDRVPLITAAPQYPENAKRDRIEGEVKVCYLVDKHGRPYRVGVRNSTHRTFERPSLRAVKASSYAPLKSGEQPSSLKTCRTFRFQLEPVETPVEIDNFADRSVFDISMMIVIGPTPPGTGVMAAAISDTSS
jgi:TonB family protein